MKRSISITDYFMVKSFFNDFIASYSSDKIPDEGLIIRNAIRYGFGEEDAPYIASVAHGLMAEKFGA